MYVSVLVGLCCV